MRCLGGCHGIIVKTTRRLPPATPLPDNCSERFFVPYSLDFFCAEADYFLVLIDTWRKRKSAYEKRVSKLAFSQ